MRQFYVHTWNGGTEIYFGKPLKVPAPVYQTETLLTYRQKIVNSHNSSQSSRTGVWWSGAEVNQSVQIEIFWFYAGNKEAMMWGCQVIWNASNRERNCMSIIPSESELSAVWREDRVTWIRTHVMSNANRKWEIIFEADLIIHCSTSHLNSPFMKLKSNLRLEPISIKQIAWTNRQPCPVNCFEFKATPGGKSRETNDGLRRYREETRLKNVFMTDY